MEEKFPYIDSLSSKGFISRMTVALMIDRIRTSKQQPQLYGTQLKIDSLGNYALFPIEDEINVDFRRKEVGLYPLKEYLKEFGLDYVPPKKNE